MNDKIDPIELKLKALALRSRGKGKEGCPSDEPFAAYMDGRLEGEEAEKIRAHVTGCADCHQAYTIWMESLPGDGPPVPARLLQAAQALAGPPLKRVVVKLLKKAFEILNPEEVALRPAMGALSRGSGEEGRYEFADIESDVPCLDAVRIQHLEDTGTLKVTLKRAMDDESRVRVDVYAGETMVQSWPLGNEGVSLNPLEKGTYRINVVEQAGRPLGTMELDLRA